MVVRIFKSWVWDWGRSAIESLPTSLYTLHWSPSPKPNNQTKDWSSWDSKREDSRILLTSPPNTKVLMEKLFGWRTQGGSRKPARANRTWARVPSEKMMGLDTEGFPTNSCGDTVLASSGTFTMWGLMGRSRSQGCVFQDYSKEQSRWNPALCFPTQCHRSCSASHSGLHR